MSALSICPDCSGFVPADATCPHCAVEAPKTSRAMNVLKRSLRFVAAGAMTVTISACYGAGPICEDEDCMVESIEITGGDAVVLGSDLQLTATGTLNDGTLSDITLSATWDTNDQGVATVSAGLVSGVSPGSATISASQDGVTGFATVTVGTGSTISVTAAEPRYEDVETGDFLDDGPG